jgi:D-lactate dehydrogenase (cytochrome)
LIGNLTFKSRLFVCQRGRDFLYWEMESANTQAVPARPEPSSAPAPVKVEGARSILDDFPSMLTDESRMPGGAAERIFFPFSEFQISEILRASREQATPVTVSSGRTGIVGGAVPLGGTLVSLEKYSRLLDVRWDGGLRSWCVRAEPGLTLANLDKILKDPGMFDGKPSGDENGTRQPARWAYPVDPTERTAQIGGTVATNASGSRSLRFGPTRNRVTGLRAVLMDGSVLDLKRGTVVSADGRPFRISHEGRTVDVPAPGYEWPDVKNTAGYFSRRPLDLMDLFIGSEGTLGVISEVELMLSIKPEAVFGGVAFFRSEQEAVRFAREAGANAELRPSALEFFDAHGLRLISGLNTGDPAGKQAGWPAFPDFSRAAVYFEQPYPPDALDAILSIYDRLLAGCGSSMNDAWGAADEREMEKMAAFRHALPETVNSLIASRKLSHSAIHKVSTDFAVPETRFDEMFAFYRSTLDASGLEYLIFGHIGEFHLHVNIIPGDEKELYLAKKLAYDMAGKAVALGGTVSAEHGIGKLKKDFLALQYSEKSLNSMKNTKKALDPACLLGRETLMKAF